jgi:hypothetical protein
MFLKNIGSNKSRMVPHPRRWHIIVLGSCIDWGHTIVVEAPNVVIEFYQFT